MDFCSNVDWSLSKPAFLSHHRTPLYFFLCLSFCYVDLINPCFWIYCLIYWSHQRVNTRKKFKIFISKQCLYFTSLPLQKSFSFRNLKALFHCILVFIGLIEKSSTILILNPFVLLYRGFFSFFALLLRNVLCFSMGFFVLFLFIVLVLGDDYFLSCDL